MDIGGHVNQVLPAIVKEGNLHVKVASCAHTIADAGNLFQGMADEPEPTSLGRKSRRFSRKKRPGAEEETGKARISLPGAMPLPGGHHHHSDVAKEANVAPQWMDLYCVLFNDGRLRCFESKQLPLVPTASVLLRTAYHEPL